MRISRVISVFACAGLFALTGCKAQQIGQTPAEASRYVTTSPVMASVQGGPSLFAGDRLAFRVLAAGGYGPAPDGMRYAEVETYFLGFPSRSGFVEAGVTTY
ncbi:MAG: hypothetical protein AAFP26_06230 [Planctomycetota bacterium]